VRWHDDKWKQSQLGHLNACCLREKHKDGSTRLVLIVVIVFFYLMGIWFAFS